jgi:hypothetical protein
MRAALSRAARTIAIGFVIATTACSPRPPNATPDGAVRELVERLLRAQGDPADARAAFDLLSKRAQENLASRARRYSAATGKTMTPEAMLVPARFITRFVPQRYSAQLAGAYALVDVVGLLPADHAQIPCVFEDGAWRVDVSLPPLPAVQLRPGNGT